MIDTNKCWLFAGYKNAAGYGECFVDGRKALAHRISYENFVGEIPDGMVIDHLCRVTCCINPDHLEAVTNVENVLRGVGYPAINKRKTHCPSGHEYTEENISKYSNNYRRCRQCENARNRKYYAAHKEKWKKYNRK
jgi:hypothetical protein